MAVLIEGYSVVIRGEEVSSKWPGGWKEFEKEAPNRTLCADGEIIRVGFMHYEDALAYCKTLEVQGIMEANKNSVDGYAHVGQLQGPKLQPNWLEFGHTSNPSDPTMRIAMCRLIGDERLDVFFPDGWTYENSLSDKPNYVSNEEAEERLERIRRRDGIEVYYDKKTRKQVFVGRTGEDKKK